MNKKLDHIEKHLQKLFEEKLFWIFTGRRPSESLIARLVRAMQENLKHTQEAHTIAPDQYFIKVNPADLLDWRNYQDILDEIAEHLHQKGQHEGLHFPDSPSITLISDPKTPKHEYSISVRFSIKKQPMPDTSAMPNLQPGDIENRIPEDAYLIVKGTKTFPLKKVVINIGRHSENDLILDDPHISRHHAQLRVINRHYVLFDVGSTGGVYLNKDKITQATLQTGDVIRLGTIKLIYVQDSVSEDPTTAFLLNDEGNPK